MSDFFKFENEKLDFPFYNGKPSLSAIDWLLLVAGVLVFIWLLFSRIEINDYVVSVLLTLSVLIPLLYVCKGKFSLFFRKPERQDILLIIICLLGYYIYAISLNTILSYFGIGVNANVSTTGDMGLVFWITMLFQLLGEELFKVIILLIVMFLVYKFTNKRKLSMVCGVIISLLIFGLVHYNAYNGALLQIIFTIGLGSFIYFFAYLKTKNVMVSYITHILIDGIVFMLVMIVNSLGLDVASLIMILI